MARIGGSASTLLSLAAGLIAAAAIALAWVPLSRDAVDREQQGLERRLRVTAELGAHLVAQTGIDAASLTSTLQTIATHGDASRVAVETADGMRQAQVPEGGPRLPSGDIICPKPGDEGPRAESFVEREQLMLTVCATTTSGDRVIVSAPARVDDALSATRLRATALFLGLGLTVGLVVAGLTRWLLSPVKEVSEAASRIAAGARGVRVEPRGPDEIAQLSRAVNALAGAFESREDEISTRLEVVTQLSSMVAHEVRNPLQSLSLLCALARTEPDEGKRTSILQKIEDEIHVLEGVVQRFLRNSGPLQISQADVDLVMLVNRAAAIAEPEARSRGVRLMVQAPGALRGFVDGSLVRRALENLMLNAIEFASHSPPGQVTVAVVPRGRSALLIVDDDGPGVPKEDQERIFEAYFSSKSGGTGLGLALVKQVIVAHGGTIQCIVSPLGGARFEAILPLVPPGDDA